MHEADLNTIFEKIDFNNDNEINYSEFLAATMNKEKVVSESNLKFAFHHFDVDNSGFITAENLQEAFKRQGRLIELSEVQGMIAEIKPENSDRITLAEFSKMMKEVNN